MKVFSVDDHIIVFDCTFWLNLYKPEQIICWLQQVWFEKIPIFIWCIFLLTFCVITIPINWSFKFFPMKLISLSIPSAEKTQYFVHLSFNSTLQLINDISSELQKLLKYFNGTAIAKNWKPGLKKAQHILKYK